ncbi:MAG: SUMF1/EgtB/PvdO family nonheme iron enzyme [Christensenellales bacterium]|jgi:hypothetical protein
MRKIKMMKVPAATFMMGGGEIHSSPDGLPVHEVNLSSFSVAHEPVSAELFDEFYKQTYGRSFAFEGVFGFATGMTWHEAEAFCRWLSEKEGENYRLPTEAEWEYCARNSRALNIDRMCDLNLREWCYDWYEPYPQGEDGAEVKDPAGPDSGLNKIIRGGFLDNPVNYNAWTGDVWLRCALPPAFGADQQDHKNPFGRHNIGFRVVKAPAAKPHAKRAMLFSFPPCVRQENPVPAFSSEKPYFRKRHLLPAPPDNASHEDIVTAGLDPLFRNHHHSPGFAAAPNGDLLVSIYSTYHEYDAESGLAWVRLPFGCDEWEEPEMIINAVGVNDHAPSMFTDDDGAVYHFWGWPKYESAHPFQYVKSTDSCETFEPVVFPKFTEKAEHVVAQPVNTAFKAKDGYYYLTCDSDVGASSVLWRSKDLINWENPKGRTAGRHSTAVELKGGGILAMGGKNSDIDGYMPKAVSYDGGDTWEVSKTPFAALSSGQRPCIIRLKSGLLMMCGDFQNKQGERPAAEERWGSYVAYSSDEGENWTIKSLWGAQHRKKQPHLFGGASTIGYSVSRQSPDGLIHIIATNVHPCLHFTFNEAWLLAPESACPGDEVLLKSSAREMLEVQEYKEYYKNGQLKCEYSAGMADDGRFLLHGQAVWRYENGGIKQKGGYSLGKRTGEHSRFDQEGKLLSSREYLPDGSSVAKTYYPNHAIRSIAHYKGSFAHGEAKLFSPQGKLISSKVFNENIMAMK